MPDISFILIFSLLHIFNFRLCVCVCYHCFTSSLFKPFGTHAIKQNMYSLTAIWFPWIISFIVCVKNFILFWIGQQKSISFATYKVYFSHLLYKQKSLLIAVFNSKKHTQHQQLFSLENASLNFIDFSSLSFSFIVSNIESVPHSEITKYNFVFCS